MNISDYLRTALLNHTLGQGSYNPPTRVWAGLYTISPTSAGGGAEVSAPDYARVQTTWSVASLGQTSNSLDIRFPTTGLTSSNWGTITNLGLFDAPSAGNMLFYGPLSATVQLAMGTDFKISASGLTISLS